MSWAIEMKKTSLKIESELHIPGSDLFQCKKTTPNWCSKSCSNSSSSPACDKISAISIILQITQPLTCQTVLYKASLAKQRGNAGAYMHKKTFFPNNQASCHRTHTSKYLHSHHNFRMSCCFPVQVHDVLQRQLHH